MIINSFIEIFALIIVYNILFEKIGIKSLCFGALVAGISIIPNKYTSSVNIVPLNLIISIVIIFIALKLLYKTELYRIIVRLFISFIFILIAEAIVGVIAGISKVDTGSTMLTIILVLVFVAAFAVARFYARNLALEIEDILLDNIKMYLLPVVNCSLIFILFQYINNRINLTNGELQVVFVIALAMIIINVILIKHITSEIRRKNTLEIENQYNPILDQYFESLKAKEHEYKNHLNIIYTMLEVSDEENIRFLIKDYIKDTTRKDHLHKLMYLENDILKALIYSKICETEEKGIDFKYELNTNLKNLRVDNSELVILLSNLLNNAIEAAEESERKAVYLTILKSTLNDSETYKFIVQNTVKNFKDIDLSNIFHKGYSTKADGRGFGLYNVQKIVKKVNGNIFIEFDKDMIRFQVDI